MRRNIIVLAALFIMGNLNAQNRDLVQYVNTMQGSHNTEDFSHGRCSPMVGLPLGMNYWAPGGYPYNLDTIPGFGSRGGFSFMPIAGRLDLDQTKFGAAFNPEKVTGKPHYYKVTFDNGITTEITATERCGYFQISYPRNQQGYIVINGNANQMDIDAGKQTITSNRGNLIVQFNQPFVSSGEMNGAGVYVEFKKGAKVQFKVANSRLSMEQARTTLEREIGTSSFDEVKAAGFKIWNDLLNKIVVEGGTPEQQKTFYSCLFRANTRPSKLYEIDKNGDPHFSYNGKVLDGKYHSHPTFWDNFRSQLPLQNILNTEAQKEYLQSLEKSYTLTGWLPNGMIGNHASSVFADAWAKGIRTFNPDSALAYYYHEVTHSRLDESNGYFIEHQRGVGRFGHTDYFAMGFIPYPKNSTKVTESTSRTLEYAYDDFCAYKLAQMTGNKFYEDVFKEHMYNYKNVFDPSDHFMKARHADGTWDKNFNPYEWGGPFVEGNGWQWKFTAQHDPQGLIDLIGGDEQFIKELDELFIVPSDSAPPGGYGFKIHEIAEVEAGGQGQYQGGNEPCFHIPYLYDYAGEPWKAQKLVRETLTKLFNSGPKGFPGDEDGGSMSSWYVLCAMGFHSVTPGVAQYAIGTPLFDKATINLENGNSFTITAENNSTDNFYIESATLNGNPWTKNWISHDDIMKGGELHFIMSNQPNKQRGILDEDKPYSVSRGY